MINGHGDEILLDESRPFYNFSNTVWFSADHTLLGKHLSANLIDNMRHYPEPDAATLRKMIAHRQSLSEDSIVVTNGPTQAIYYIAQAFEGKRALLPYPAFAEYRDAALLYNSPIKSVPSTLPLSEWDFTDVDYCYIVNPNNPDGTIYSHTELMRTIDKHPEVVFVLDQCYANYTTNNKVKAAECKHRPNIITLWSFSHAYGIPGLRIGYIAASESYAQAIKRFIAPWSVNTFALEAAKYILIHPAQFTLPIRKWQRSAQELMNKLHLIDNIEVIPSETTFFLIRLKKGTARELKDYLAQEHNMLIRDAGNFEGLDDSYARITALDEAANNLLVDAVAAWMATQA